MSSESKCFVKILKKIEIVVCTLEFVNVHVIDAILLWMQQ